MIHISSGFDGGAITVLSVEDTGVIRLAVRRDSHADFTQWFYFRLSGARGRVVSISLENAAQCTYPGGWENYRAVASTDRDHWWRAPTRYVDGRLVIEHRVVSDVIYYAYFEPYSWERHLRLIGQAQRSPLAQVRRLTETVDGRDLDLVHIRDASANAPRKVWVIARQHPGETMAEWFVEGLIERLLDSSDPEAAQALSLAEFFIVPNMNPDGSVRGNLRTNAAGANLNREWLEPSLERSPEVYAVRAAMRASGVDLFIDAHGDEVLPYVFVAGSEMLPGFGAAARARQDAFIARFKEATSEFQDRYGYPANKYSSDALKLASKWVGHEFGCLSLTLEMPFKDNANQPDADVGWNGARSKRLGAAILRPIIASLEAEAAGTPRA